MSPLEALCWHSREHFFVEYFDGSTAMASVFLLFVVVVACFHSESMPVGLDGVFYVLAGFLAAELLCLRFLLHVVLSWGVCVFWWRAETGDFVEFCWWLESRGLAQVFFVKVCC